MAEKVFALYAPWSLRWTSRQWSKRQPGIKMAVRNKNGRKRSEKIFALYAPWYSRWPGWKRRSGRKKEVRKKMAEKGPINFSRFMRHFPTTTQSSPCPHSFWFTQTLSQLTIYNSSLFSRLPHDPLNAVIPYRFVHLGSQKPKLYLLWLHFALPSIPYPIDFNQKALRGHHHVRNLRWHNHCFYRRYRVVHNHKSVFRCENQLFLIFFLHFYLASAFFGLMHMHHNTRIATSLSFSQHALNGYP